jgi:hypothetical protein
MITIREEEISRTFVRNTDEGPKKMCYFREQLFAFKQTCKHEKEASIICRALLADNQFCLISKSKDGATIWLEVREVMNITPVEDSKTTEPPMQQINTVRTAVAKDDTAQLSIRNFNPFLPTQAKEKIVACSDGLIIFRHARV